MKIQPIKNNLIMFMLAVLLFSCKGESRKSDQQATKPTAREKTTKEILLEKPRFPSFRHFEIYPGESPIFMRLIANNNTDVKAWLVYYDYGHKRWVTWTTLGKGENNKVLADTVLPNRVTITDSIR